MWVPLGHHGARHSLRVSGAELRDLCWFSNSRFSSEPLCCYIAGFICAEETVIDGFESIPTAFASLFVGGNTGKILVRAKL